MKRLEASLYSRMAERFKSVDPKQRTLGFVTTTSFLGMDVNPFATEIAKVTMMLAHKLSIDEFDVSEAALPLDNLDATILHRDALIGPDGATSPWPKTDVIIGNPPFLGAKKLKPELGETYMKLLRDAYPEVPGMADLCVYWIRRAADELGTCTAGDPFVGRAGLVGTQNIRSNQSRVGGLDHVVSTGTIVEAVESQPWSGDANVDVSIVNWVKSQDQTLLPSRRRLWFRAHDPKKALPKGSGAAHKRFDLDMREATFINASLSDKIDVTSAGVLACNTSPQRVFQGQTPGHEGFMLTPQQREDVISKDPHSGTVIHEFLGGKQILAGRPTPSRFVIDFEQLSVVDAANFKEAFARIRDSVLPKREAGAKKDAHGTVRPHHEQFLSRWWQLAWGRADLLHAIGGFPRYLACSRVTKRPLFVFVRGDIRPGDSLQVFAFDDDYSFGILQALPHQQWFIAKSSKLTERLRYTPNSVFDTLPWPQFPSAATVAEVAKAAVAVRETQRVLMHGKTGGLRSLYSTFELPGKNPLKAAHADLDTAVLRAYGFSSKKAVLQQLLDLNSRIARDIKANIAVTSPGPPPNYPNMASLVTGDCLGLP